MRSSPKKSTILTAYGLAAGFFLLAMGCVGISGSRNPAGSGAAAPGGNAVGENSAALAEAALNPGSVQSGGEGHGQEQKKTPNYVSVNPKEGRGNCGVPRGEAQEVFVPEGPVLQLAFSSSETGPFSGAKTLNANRFGQSGIPECPLVLPMNDGTRRFMSIHFVRVVATWTDAAGKSFESLPKVITCQAVCETPSCEVCIDLKAESEIPDSERIVSAPSEPEDGLKRIDWDGLPSLEETNPRGLRPLNPNIDLNGPLKTSPSGLNR
ncbi:MAG: hypothetical protein U1F66_01005 [bacterium]